MLFAKKRTLKFSELPGPQLSSDTDSNTLANSDQSELRGGTTVQLRVYGLEGVEDTVVGYKCFAVTKLTKSREFSSSARSLNHTHNVNVIVPSSTGICQWMHPVHLDLVSGFSTGNERPLCNLRHCSIVQ